MSKEFCHNCRFWEANASGSREAPARSKCLVFPPQPAGVIPVQTLTGPAPQIIWGWPEPSQNEWCGQWAPAKGLIS